MNSIRVGVKISRALSVSLGVMLLSGALVGVSGRTTPVFSHFEIRGGSRGVALVMGADGQFTMRAVATNHKNTPIVILTLFGVIYGLSDFAYEDLPSSSPIRKISVTEKPESLMAVITLRLDKAGAQPELRQRDRQWLVLVSREPVTEFFWSAPLGASAGSGGLPTQKNLLSQVPSRPHETLSQGSSATPSAAPKKGGESKSITSTPSSPAIQLVDVRIMKRDKVEELILDFDVPVKLTSTRNGNVLMMAIANAQSKLSIPALPSGSAFTGLSVGTAERVGVKWLTISVTLDKKDTSNVIITQKKTHVGLAVVRSSVRGFGVWSATGNHNVSVPFASEDNLDFSRIEQKAEADAQKDIAAENTFSLRPSQRKPEAAITPVGESKQTGAAAAPAVEKVTSSEPIKSPSVASPAPAPVTPPAPTVRITVLKDKVNLRKTASNESAVIRQLSMKTTGWKLASKGDWVKLALDRDSGWVSARLIMDSTQLPDTFWVPKAVALPRPDITQTLVEALPAADRVKAEATLSLTSSQPEVAKPVLTRSADSVRFIRYRVRARDPFVPLKPNMISTLLPDIEKTSLVGILFDPSDRVALLEDPANAARTFALRERDKVSKGTVLKIEQERVTFLLTEFGISRTVTMKLSRAKTPAVDAGQPGTLSGGKALSRSGSTPPREEEGL